MTTRFSKQIIHYHLFISVCILAFNLSPNHVHGKVSGECGNCHTMHNSQDGSSLVHTGTGAGWSAGGEITGGSVQDAPIDNLLISDCVGCHSSSTSETIITLGSNKIPIVFNTNAYPPSPLAGGNFFQVSQGEAFDGYGHNVYGISDIDSKLVQAPGGNNRCWSATANSCHFTLAVPPNGENWQRGGCRGCHYNVFHHEDNNNYRFLNSHKGDQYYVEGVEDANWEHQAHGGRNSYKGIVREATSPALMNSHSISSYCGGCHPEFHQNEGISGNNAVWLRHPTDYALPLDGEYAEYNPVSDYNMEAPVAWVNPETPVREEAIVMCLSCHRVHGSEHPDLLRWDYDNMVAGNGGAFADTGCFVCHSSKD